MDMDRNGYKVHEYELDWYRKIYPLRPLTYSILDTNQYCRNEQKICAMRRKQAIPTAEYQIMPKTITKWNYQHKHDAF